MATEPVFEPAETLLRRVEPLAYPQRMRQLASHARTFAGDHRLSTQIRELLTGDRYRRHTALHLAMAGREIALIGEILAGEDHALRRGALRAVRTLPVPDDLIPPVLEDAPADLRQALYRTLEHSHRTALAERLLPVVLERYGARDAAALLPACGPQTVARRLPELAHAVTAWARLGRRHPDAVLDIVDQEIRDGAHTYRLIRRWKAGIAAAATARPGRFLDLIERHDLGSWLTYLPPASKQALLRADALRVFTLRKAARRSWRSLDAIMVRHLRTFTDEQLQRMLPKQPWHAAEIMKAVQPSRRPMVFDAMHPEDSGIRGMELLPLLPREKAASEARRMLDWHASVWHSARRRLDDPELTLRLTSHLPYEEAVTPIRDAAFRGDQRRRSLARTLLIECTARTGDKALFSALLGELAERTVNEQDPLRGAVLTALAGVRPGILDDSCAGHLDLISKKAVNSRDSSETTRDALRALVRRVLHHHRTAALTAWALKAITDLVDRFGAEGLGALHALDLWMRKDQEHDLVAVLRPHLADGAVAVALARALRGRARNITDLQEALKAAILKAPEETAGEAAELWLARMPDRDDRAASILGEAPEMIRIPGVWRTVASRRTDLLDVPKPGDWAPDVPNGRRWTPDQCANLLADLSGRAADPDQEIGTRLTVIRALGGIPGSQDAVASLARNTATVPAEAALETLARTAPAENALKLLLEHAKGASSPVAVAALPQAARSAAPSFLLAACADTLHGPEAKVTARKAAARELARLPQGIGPLLQAWNDAGLHPDVRLAVAVSLRRSSDDPRAIEALHSTATEHASELMFRTLMQTTPNDVPPRSRPGFADLVRSFLDHADDPGVTFRAARAFATWAPWYSSGVAGIASRVADTSLTDAEAGLPAFVALLRQNMLRDEVLPVLRDLMVYPEGRSRVREILRALPRTGLKDGPQARLLREAGRLLARDPLWLPHAAGLSVELLDLGGDRLALALEVSALAELLGDRPVLATQIAGRLERRMYRSRDPRNLLPAARTLIADGGLAAGMLALTFLRSALESAGPDSGWNAVLADLRASPQLEVRLQALDLEPAI